MIDIKTPRIKICCIQSPAEARLVFQYGVDAIKVDLEKLSRFIENVRKGCS